MAGEFQKSLDKFEKSADWLGDADAPALAALRAMAAELDGGGAKPALYSQWGLHYRALLKRAPSTDDADSDPLEDIINRGRGA